MEYLIVGLIVIWLIGTLYELHEMFDNINKIRKSLDEQNKMLSKFLNVNKNTRPKEGEIKP